MCTEEKKADEKLRIKARNFLDEFIRYYDLSGSVGVGMIEKNPEVMYWLVEMVKDDIIILTSLRRMVELLNKLHGTVNDEKDLANALSNMDT